MPFLKEFIINEKTKIKLWKVMLGELNPNKLNICLISDRI